MMRNWFYLLIFLFVVIFSIMPSYSMAKSNIEQSVPKEEIWALLYLKTQTQSDSVVLSRYDEGHMINSLAERRNVMDSNFLLTDDIDERLEDVNLLYVTPFSARALQYIRKYKINYIYLSEETKKQFKIDDITYAKLDKNCFQLVYQNDKSKIYKVICE